MLSGSPLIFTRGRAKQHHQPLGAACSTALVGRMVGLPLAGPACLSTRVAPLFGLPVGHNVAVLVGRQHLGGRPTRVVGLPLGDPARFFLVWPSLLACQLAPNLASLLGSPPLRRVAWATALLSLAAAEDASLLVSLRRATSALRTTTAPGSLVAAAQALSLGATPRANHAAVVMSSYGSHSLSSSLLANSSPLTKEASSLLEPLTILTGTLRPPKTARAGTPRLLLGGTLADLASVAQSAGSSGSCPALGQLATTTAPRPPVASPAL
jgi:hypothetical protein